jgi:hypothetical protein
MSRRDPILSPAFVNACRVICPGVGVLRMDIVSLVSGLLAAQAGKVQTQVAATILKSNLDAEKSTVLTLLGAAQQSPPSLANVGAGVGGNLNISA